MHQWSNGRWQRVCVLLALGCRSAAVPPEAPVAAVPPADLVISAPVIWTGEAEPREDAHLVVRGGRVVDVVGTGALPAAVGPDTRTARLEDATCVPGLTDAHAHPAGLGSNLEIVDLRGADSVEEVVRRVREGAPPTGWIFGRGWDQNLWPGGEMPTHHVLTEAFPDRPVWLRRVDGHAGWGNATVISLAGITSDTESPEGGEILRDASGEATGVFVDNASELVPVPEADAADVGRWLRRAQAHLVSLGITGVHDMGVGPSGDAVYRELAAAGELSLRITGYASEDWFTEAVVGERAPEAVGVDTRYALVGVKVYADGALGSRGAALSAPYSDRPEHAGLLSRDPASFLDVYLPAFEDGWQVATHAIGDRAIREVLAGYAAAVEQTGQEALRPRVEHAQIMGLDDIPSFVSQGVVASMQPTHATSDMPWVPSRIGEHRMEGAYAWRRFLDAGVHLAFGSDFPVERPEITHGIYAAMTRQDAAGMPEGGWLPDQRLSLQEALSAFSAGAAFAAHQEPWLGVLRPGFAADVSCFRGDLFAMPPLEVRDAEAVLTVVAGEVVYERAVPSP